MKEQIKEETSNFLVVATVGKFTLKFWDISKNIKAQLDTQYFWEHKCRKKKNR